MQSEIGIYTTDVSKKIKSIYKDVLTESRINNPKYKQSILDYEVANTLNSITNVFTSAYNDVKTALDHTKHVMDMQTERDAKALLNNMKGFTPDKIEKNMQAFKDVFHNDYGQRYMQQLTENPLLNRLISQEDDKLYITLNGKKFDLEKLSENQASHFTTQTMHEISQAETKEKGTQIFRFVRVSPVKNERDHSIHDNEHNDDYFTTNAELVGTEFDGKILLDAYTAIEDYHYGDQPPYGCQHIFVGVEEVGNVSKYYAARSNEEALKAIENAREKCGLLHTEMSQQQIIEYNNFIKSELSPKSFFGTQFAPKCNILAKALNKFSGEYDYKTKTIFVNEIYKKGLLGAIYKIKKNILLNADEAYAFVTYLHEKIHSETFTKIITNEYDRALREGLTEYLARTKLYEYSKLTIKKGRLLTSFLPKAPLKV